MRRIELTKNPEFIIRFEEYNTVINKEHGTIKPKISKINQ